jgi:hypothetical protein
VEALDVGNGHACQSCEHLGWVVGYPEVILGNLLGNSRTTRETPQRRDESAYRSVAPVTGNPVYQDLACKQDKHTIWAAQAMDGGKQRLSFSGVTHALNERRHRQSRNRNAES